MGRGHDEQPPDGFGHCGGYQPAGSRVRHGQHGQGQPAHPLSHQAPRDRDRRLLAIDPGPVFLPDIFGRAAAG
jgi:hypothetical protein